MTFQPKPRYRCGTLHHKTYAVVSRWRYQTRYVDIVNTKEAIADWVWNIDDACCPTYHYEWIQPNGKPRITFERLFA